MKGRIHSLESFGTVDGPGVRFVVFVQGCPMRCAYCHNPDTWPMDGGTMMEPAEIYEQYKRNEGFYKGGGITVTGGEPLMQIDFLIDLFTLAKADNVHTCLDTSGDVLNDDVKALLLSTDRVLLDIKYTDNESYKENVGCDYDRVIEFLAYLDSNRIPTTLRQVIIPTINDNKENIDILNTLANSYSCVSKVELLPFKKICQTKYDDMNLNFPFGKLEAAKKEDVQALLSHIDKK